MILSLSSPLLAGGDCMFDALKSQTSCNVTARGGGIRRRWDSNPRAQLITRQPDFESGPLRPLRYSSAFGEIITPGGGCKVKLRRCYDA